MYYKAVLADTVNCALICQDHHTPSTLWCTSEKTASCCAARGSRSRAVGVRPVNRIRRRRLPFLILGGELAHRREAWVFIISRGGRGHSPRVARRPLLAPLGPPRAPPRRRALPKRTTPPIEWSVTLRQPSARERANPPAPEESKSRAHTLDAHVLLSIDPPTVPLRQGREIPPSARIGQWLARLVVVVSACPPLE